MMEDKHNEMAARMVSRRAFLRLGGGLLLASSTLPLLAACGGDDEEEPDTPGAATPMPTQGAGTSSPNTSGAAAPSPTEGAGTTSTEAPNAASLTPDVASGSSVGNFKSGGVLNVAIGTDISSLEPQVTTETSSQGPRWNMYDTLVWGITREGELLPWLAESWEASEDGLTYTFTLTDKQVKFHDGTDFNADAVKATFDRLLHPDRTGAAKLTLDFVTNVEVVDSKTVRFTLGKVFAPYLRRMADSPAAILSPRAIGELGENYGTNPVGTGPYKFVEYVKGDHVTFEKFPDYWNGEGNYDQIVYRIAPEDTSRATLLQTGEVQVADRISPVLAAQLQSNDDVTIQKDFTSRLVFFRLNQNRELMNDAQVRRAVNHAVDKNAIVANILKGFGRPATSPLTPVIQFHSAQEPYDYDPEKAKTLLREAGVAEGTKMTIWSPQGRYVADIDWATAVQSMMQEIGFDAELQGFGDFPAYIQELDSLEWDMAIWGWANGNDPDSGLQPWMSRFSETFPNWGSYSNPRVDELIEAAVTTLDESTRAEQYGEIQQLIWEDAADLFMHDQSNLTGVSKQVDGVFVNVYETLIVRDSGYIA